jgi:hypothetical protein
MTASFFGLSQHDAGSAAVAASMVAVIKQCGGASVAGPCAAYPFGSHREVHTVAASGSSICRNGMDGTIGQPGICNAGALHG